MQATQSAPHHKPVSYTLPSQSLLDNSACKHCPVKKQLNQRTESISSLQQITNPARAPITFEVMHGRFLLRILAVLLTLVLVGTVIGFALFAPKIMPYDPNMMSISERLQAPSAAHWLGTDAYGRDLFSRIVVGARDSLSVAVGAVLISLIPGVLIGMIAGLKRGWLEHITTQIMDAWLALPGLLLALVMAAAFGRSLHVLMFALGLASIPAFYRICRAETMRVANEEYVAASVACGAALPHLLMRHILPGVAPSLIVIATLRVGQMLLATSALGFIGLGAPPPTPEWGALLAEAREYMHMAWWLMWYPGLAIALTVFGFNLLGDRLRDWLNPDLR